MSEFFDLVIIGAGPAGMAAAITSTGLGLNVAVIDEQSNPGGQDLYRAIESVSYERPALMKSLGDDYAAGLKLVQRFRASGANFLPQTSVWQIDGDRDVFTRTAGGTARIATRQILIATGAMERPVRVPAGHCRA